LISPTELGDISFLLPFPSHSRIVAQFPE